MGVWILVALLVLLIGIALLPVTLSGRFHLEGLNGRVQYRIGVGPLAFTGAQEFGELLAEAPRHERQTKRATPAFVPKAPGALLQWARPSIDYLRRRGRFRRLTLFVVVGGLDAFESALLAGAVWTVAGTFGSILSHIFVLPPGLYRVTVEPNWQEPALGVNLDCMLTFRVGHAIWAGVLLVPQALKSARAARRRQRREKGEEARG
ncbi:MAG TPA: DUF2953 domain-containing protein [Symbiobacteriaceae bacterium]|nr:DUF2953 domain-containing protein [Symbiobacteriaceae bacterium]